MNTPASPESTVGRRRPLIGGILSAAAATLLAVVGVFLGHASLLAYVLIVAYMPLMLIPSLWDWMGSFIVFGAVAGFILWFALGAAITTWQKKDRDAIAVWLLVYLATGALGMVILELVVS